MTPSGMADYIIQNVKGKTDAGSAINAFYRALCEYVEKNAEVTYSLVGVDSKGNPDSTTVIKTKLQTAGSLSPSGESDSSAALSRFSSDLNSQASLWTVLWPAEFSLSPSYVLPSISITASGATEMTGAWNFVCSQIIQGLKAATPVSSGTHISYTGAASFISLL